MAFSNAQIEVISRSAIDAVHADFVRLNDFALDLTDLEEAPGTVVKVPVFELSGAADFNEDTNNYCSGVDEGNFLDVSLNKHLVKSVAITDRALAETQVAWYQHMGRGIGTVLAEGIQSTIFGAMNATNVPTEVSADLSTKAPIASLVKVTVEANLPVSESIVVLNPTEYSKVLAAIGDSYVYGGNEVIRYGYIPGLYGFRRFVQSNYLPQGVKGVILSRSSLAVASRYLAPQPGAYVDTFKATDPDTGITLGFRSFTELCKGKRFLAGEVLMGFAIKSNRAIRIV